MPLTEFVRRIADLCLEPQRCCRASIRLNGYVGYTKFGPGSTQRETTSSDKKLPGMAARVCV